MLLSAETLPEEKRMPIRAKYVHTNLIARDWERLVRFYREVFGCEPKGPERDLSAAWLDRVNSVPNARLRGVHLQLPGYDDDGPTLEIFSQFLRGLIPVGLALFQTLHADRLQIVRHAGIQTMRRNRLNALSLKQDLVQRLSLERRASRNQVIEDSTK